MTTQKLKARVLGLYAAIYKFDCYSTHDLREYDWAVAELEKRGFVVEITSNITIRRKSK